MRIVFIGAVEFSRHCLELTLDAGGEVVGVLTIPPKANRFNADAADLAGLARTRGVPVHQVAKINDPAAIALVRDLKPDVLFVFGFSQLIGPELLAIPRLGSVGVHPALLPEGRGRHPLIWALVLGLPRSGLSFFWMGEGADDGPLLWQKAFDISQDDDAASLYARIKDLAAEAIPQFLPQLAGGDPPRIPQDESRATVWRKRGEADGEIQWNGPARIACDLIRALTRPYVGAHTFLGDQRILVWKSRPEACVAADPGVVVDVGTEGPLVRAQDGGLRLLNWTGPALKAGDRLGGKR